MVVRRYNAVLDAKRGAKKKLRTCVLANETALNYSNPCARKLEKVEEWGNNVGHVFGMHNKRVRR